MKKLVELEIQQGHTKYFMGLFLKMNSIAVGLNKIKQLTKSPLNVLHNYTKYRICKTFESLLNLVKFIGP